MNKGQFIKGSKPWNKGIKGIQPYHNIEGLALGRAWNKGKSFCAGENNPMYGKHHTEETKRKISIAKIGVKQSLEIRLIKSKTARKGINHHFWKGGITAEQKRDRGSFKYKLWRIKVFERDNFLCQECGNNKDLQADHIKQFAYYPELRFELSNGRTLCKPCHQKTDTYLKRL